MQVFVPYASPFEVAKCLDSRRLHKQIIECHQILKAIKGKSEAWKNHPVVKMYEHFAIWLTGYVNCLELYKAGIQDQAILYSVWTDSFRPRFLTDDFCDQHKRRLYTKAPELYPQFAEYGTSDENWYVLDWEIVKYINGKKI